ncbi:hypothetical protein [Streptomyces himastatinicus]|uniref:hypothetical protein n=1 Tax=Streptomyces himastatinicus TaxID=998084 RepID=UPI0012B69F82|nr:hypothetical protein [Streptomyces himastatinicus]
MKLQMSVTPPSNSVRLTPDFELDEDYESLVMDVCQLLSQTDCRFHVSGFGQDSWPVDISYDLSSAIEQLPEALESLQRGLPAKIDFYGQGIERLVTFTPGRKSVIIKCTSNTAWAPDPDTEEVSLGKVEGMLVAFARDFKISLERACPDVAALDFFAGW